MLKLLIAYQIKHFLADFPLQNEYMLGKFKDKGWIMPLAAHAGVHAGFTFFIVMCYLAQKDIFHHGYYEQPELLVIIASFLCAMFDFIVHFTMDRIKASPKMLGRYNTLTKEQFIEALDVVRCNANLSPTTVQIAQKKLDDNERFWYSLGLDQFVHHVTHYIIIWVII